MMKHDTASLAAADGGVEGSIKRVLIAESMFAGAGYFFWLCAVMKASYSESMMFRNRMLDGLYGMVVED